MADITTRTLRNYLASLPSGGTAGAVDQNLQIRNDLGGDMTKAVYDPQGIEADAFDRANHTGTQTLSTISDAGAAAALDVGTTADTVAAGDHTHSVVTTSAPGFMSSADKAKLDGVGRWLASVAALLSDTTLTYTGGTSTTVAAGDYVFTRSEEFSYVVLASGASNPDIVTAGGVKLQSMVLNPKAFGSPATGAASDVAIFNQLVLRMNALGAGGVGVQVEIPAGTYNLKAGGINPILVNNVNIRCSEASIFLLRDGPVWTLGSSSQFIESTFIEGGQPITVVPDTPTATCSWVSGVNCARVYIRNCHPYRVPHIFYVDTTYLVTGVYLENCVGLGLPQYHWVHLDTTGGGLGSVLVMSNCSAYPYAPPANPSLSPVAITNITQANPAVVTAPSHGYATGARVRIALVGGMTQVNGLDFTITVIDANTFSLNGVNSTGYTAYTSGGRVVGLHWAWQYDTAVVGIYGTWDTAEMLGGLYQHYAYLWYLSPQSGTIGFVWDKEAAFDYGGKSRFYIELGTGFVTNVVLNGGWTFVLNEGMFTIVDNLSAGNIVDVTINNHTLGLCGAGIIDIPAFNNRINQFNVDSLRIVGVGRARRGPVTLINGGASSSNNLRLNSVWQEDPSTFVNGDTYFRPEVGIKTVFNTAFSVSNCQMNATVTNYDIPVTSVGGTLTRVVKGNRTRSGTPPEYFITQARFTGSGTVYKNNSGFVRDIFIDGGTVSDISKNGHTVFTSTGRTITVNPLESFSVTYSVAPTFSESFRD